MSELATRVRLLIVGTPRSGTTLVQRLSCSLPGVVVPYETHFFTKGFELLRGTDGAVLKGPALRIGLERYAEMPHLMGAELDVGAVAARADASPPTWLGLFDAVVGTLAGNAEILGEKTPGHLRWAGSLARVRRDLRVIAVVRDPRASIASQHQTPWGGIHVDVAARRWLDDQLTVGRLAVDLGDRCLVLRYEDVAADPKTARARIARFLGAPGSSESDAVSTQFQLPWEDWKRPPDAPITEDRISAWAQSLRSIDADRIGVICASALARYGYESALPRPWRVRWVRASMPLRARRRAQRFEARTAAVRAAINAVDFRDGDSEPSAEPSNRTAGA